MSRLYSTGPIENANLIGTVSSSVVVKLLNNNLNQNAVVEVIRSIVAVIIMI